MERTKSCQPKINEVINVASHVWTNEGCNAVPNKSIFEFVNRRRKRLVGGRVLSQREQTLKVFPHALYVRVYLFGDSHKGITSELTRRRESKHPPPHQLVSKTGPAPSVPTTCLVATTLI